MSATIIDTLTVVLGLDPRLFKKGAKDAQDAEKNLQTNVVKGANEMVGALHRVAAEFVSLFLAVRGVHDVIGVFADLNANVRQLGIDSRNTGESAAALRDYGNIAEIAGGKAEDAMATIAGLQQSVFNAHNGYGYSDQLVNFGRIGLGDIGQSSGRLQNFHDILMKTATALQQFSKPERFQWTQKLGLQGGIANAVVEGPQVLEKYWQQQLKIHQTTEGDTRAAQQLAQAWDLLKDKMRALTTQILTAVSPAIQKLFLSFGKFVSQHQGDITKGVDVLATWAAGPGPQQIIDALTAVGQAAASAAAFINSIVHFTDDHASTTAGPGGGFGANKTALEKKYGMPDMTLSRTELEGSKLGLDAAAAKLSALHNLAGGDKGDPDWQKALNAYRNSYVDYSKRGLWTQEGDWFRNKYLGAPLPGSVPAADALKATQGATATPRAAGAAAGSGASGPPTGRNQVSVTIGRIDIQAGGSDSAELAANLDMAIQRKLTVSLADTALS